MDIDIDFLDSYFNDPLEDNKGADPGAAAGDDILTSNWFCCIGFI